MALRAKRLVILNRHIAMFQQEPEGRRLAGVQSMLFRQHVGPNSSLAAFAYLIHLCRQPLHEVLEPAGQVHALVAHPLNGSVESQPVAVIELADREQTLEVLAGPVQTESGQEPRGPAVAIHERMEDRKSVV